MTDRPHHSTTMKRLGLIGGTSWHSTVQYYTVINQAVNDHFGDNTNPPLVLFNVNQARVHRCQKTDNWAEVAHVFSEAARCLEQADVELISFCANTPHKVYDQVCDSVDVPILHIADTTAAAIRKTGLKRVAFIGTLYSMQDDFVTGRIAANDIEVVVPSSSAVLKELHRIIQQELTFNQVLPESKQWVIDQLLELIEDGAQGVVLGCTEFPLMLEPQDLPVPIFDTTEIHALAAADFVLGPNLAEDG
ncbi:MAG: amino acid racemase [Fuerstiella sp.]